MSIETDIMIQEGQLKWNLNQNIPQWPVPDEFAVIPSSGREVTEEERQRLYHLFDSTIDKFLEGDDDEAIFDLSEDDFAKYVDIVEGEDG